ncbi:MAG: glycerophosphodiester phosphodiesterase [Desulfobacteraceae bacterium]|nr:glycerophosphodiester phosphodiesterase [Desulfobacteraceae bacterium]
MRPFPWLIAHRGAMAEAPENSRAAFDLAFSYNVEGIEFDVQMTADGVPVVFHDNTLRRVTGGRNTVADTRFSEISGLDFGKLFSDNFPAQRIMTLEFMLESYSGRGILMIELKSESGRREPEEYKDSLCGEVVRLIGKYVAQNLLDEIFILSFDKDLILRIMQLAPYLKYILNIKTPQQVRSNEDLFNHNSLWGYCLPRRRLTRGFAGQCREKGLHTAIYSCNSPSDVSAGVDMGADVIMTDDPGRIAGILGNKNDAL